MKKNKSFCGKVRRRLIKLFGRERQYVESLTSYLVGYSVDLDNPKTYNEKLAWIKLLK